MVLLPLPVPLRLLERVEEEAAACLRSSSSSVLEFEPSVEETLA